MAPLVVQLPSLVVWNLHYRPDLAVRSRDERAYGDPVVAGRPPRASRPDRAVRQLSL